MNWPRRRDNIRSPASRRLETIEPARIIRRLRIAESGCAVDGESIGGDGQPHRIGEVGGGFHHDDRVSGAGEVEPELTGGEAERIGLRIP